MRHIAFLRGINVGTGNRIAMADLRRVLTERGASEVRTLLNSGNVVLESFLEPAAVAELVRAAITEGLGLRIPVMVRSASEVAAALAEDPFDGIATDDSRSFIGFCAGTPTAAASRRFTTLTNEHFRTAVRGGQLYVWCPAGMIGSGFGKIKSDKEIGLEVTMRNRRTVQKLAALVEA